jgi:hypothetical protein
MKLRKKTQPAQKLTHSNSKENFTMDLEDSVGFASMDGSHVGGAINHTHDFSFTPYAGTECMDSKTQTKAMLKFNKVLREKRASHQVYKGSQNSRLWLNQQANNQFNENLSTFSMDLKKNLVKRPQNINPNNYSRSPRGMNITPHTNFTVGY